MSILLGDCRTILQMTDVDLLRIARSLRGLWRFTQGRDASYREREITLLLAEKGSIHDAKPTEGLLATPFERAYTCT